MEYKIAICDDEETQRSYLASLVKKWAKQEKHTVKAAAYDSAEAFLFAYVDDKDVDILLLDIEMGDMDGVELAKRLRAGNDTIQILFITAYPDFIAEGYEVSALHYLMKPVEKEKLYAVLDRAVCALKKAERFEVFYTDGEALRIPVDEIMIVEAFAHSVVMTTVKEEYRLHETISKIEELLGDGFLRCHRSYLVNIKYIKRIAKTEIIMDNNAEVPISRRRYDMVNQAFIRYYTI